jgi:hypothetical protein
VLTGGAAATYWRDDLTTFMSRRVPRLRTQAAEKVQVAGRAMARGIEDFTGRAHARLRPADSPAGKAAEANEPVSMAERKGGRPQ